jgi:hypothetical protein
MKDELQKKLFDKYPDIFRHKNYPPSKSLICFGCECDDGWYNILDALCRSITNHVESRISNAIYRHENNKFIDIFLGWKYGWKTFRWWKYLWTLYEDYKKRKELVNPDYYKVFAVQVKEKFGGLRFYTSGNDDIVEGMIYMAEALSCMTCEVCGQPGVISSKGYWLKALCSTCQEKYEYSEINDEPEDEN